MLDYDNSWVKQWFEIKYLSVLIKHLPNLACLQFPSATLYKFTSEVKGKFGFERRRLPPTFEIIDRIRNTDNWYF